MDPNAPYVQVKISLHNLNHLCFVSVDFKRMNKNEYKIAGLVGLIHNEIILCGGGFLTKKKKKKSSLVCLCASGSRKKKVSSVFTRITLIVGFVLKET